MNRTVIIWNSHWCRTPAARTTRAPNCISIQWYLSSWRQSHDLAVALLGQVLGYNLPATWGHVNHRSSRFVIFRLVRFEDFPPNSLQRHQQTMWQHNESVNQHKQSNLVAKFMQEINTNGKPDPKHFNEKSPRQSLSLGSRNYDRSRRLPHWDALGLFIWLGRLSKIRLIPAMSSLIWSTWSNHIKSVAFWGRDQCQAKVTEETVLVLSAQAVLRVNECNHDISWKPSDGHDWAMMAQFWRFRIESQIVSYRNSMRQTSQRMPPPRSMEQHGQVPCHCPTLLGERVWKYQPKSQQSLQTETCFHLLLML